MAFVTLHDGREVRLGLIQPKSRPKALRLSNYVDLGAVSLPEKVDYTPKAMASISRMYLNNQYGDCVIASCGHSIGVWTGNDGGTPIVATDQEISKVYFFFSPRDQGCVITQVLDYWQSKGLVLGGANRKIDGYVALNWTQQDLVKFAILYFGGVKLGINLPNAWAVSDPSTPWDVTRSQIVGGHDVLCVGYDETGVIISTWGGLRTITWAAFTSTRYLTEAYVMLAPDWYGSDNISGSGLDIATLKADLAKIGEGQIPPIDPKPTPPTPDPVPVPPVPVPTDGLTLEQVIDAIKLGVHDGGPYGWFPSVSRIEQAAITGVQDHWPRHNRCPQPGPLPSEVAAKLLGEGR